MWLGLEKLHQLTSEGSYSLRITMKDFDGKSYVAVYDQFQVIKIYGNDADGEEEVWWLTMIGDDDDVW